MGGKNIPRIRLTSAKVLVEVEAELGNKSKILKTKSVGIYFQRHFICKSNNLLPTVVTVANKVLTWKSKQKVFVSFYNLLGTHL